MKEDSISKHAKYLTRNLISKALVNRFFRRLGNLYLRIEPNLVLDIGCGEGLILRYLNTLKKLNESYAIDIDPAEVADAKKNIPFCHVEVGSIYQMSFKDNFADLVICSEVLEHIDDPLKGLKELHRVSKDRVIMSVPREPLWRLMNMARFKYWNRLGNTPDHINHWNLRSFSRFISPYFEILEIRLPLPWILLLCKKKSL